MAEFKIRETKETFPVRKPLVSKQLAEAFESIFYITYYPSEVCLFKPYWTSNIPENQNLDLGDLEDLLAKMLVVGYEIDEEISDMSSFKGKDSSYIVYRPKPIVSEKLAKAFVEVRDHSLYFPASYCQPRKYAKYNLLECENMKHEDFEMLILKMSIIGYDIDK